MLSALARKEDESTSNWHLNRISARKQSYLGLHANLRRGRGCSAPATECPEGLEASLTDDKAGVPILLRSSLGLFDRVCRRGPQLLPLDSHMAGSSE